MTSETIATLSFVSLLIHDTDVPARARAALRSALRAPASEQRCHLEVAARALYREADLDFADALELVGLADGGAEPSLTARRDGPTSCSP